MAIQPGNLHAPLADSERAAPHAPPQPSPQTEGEPRALQPAPESPGPLVPLPQQRRRLGGLAAEPDQSGSAPDRALDSISLAWLADVSVAKSLAVPVGLVI